MQKNRDTKIWVVCLTRELKNNHKGFKYHVFAPMGRFQLELILIYLYFPPSFRLIVVVSVL